MKMYNMHEAKTHLSKIMREVAAGESVLIGKGGEPLAVLSPYRKEAGKRKPGSLKGKVEILEGFDEADEEIARLFLGSAE